MGKNNLSESYHNVINMLIMLLNAITYNVANGRHEVVCLHLWLNTHKLGDNRAMIPTRSQV